MVKIIKQPFKVNAKMVREDRTMAEAFMLRSDKTELSPGGFSGFYAANLEAILFF